MNKGEKQMKGLKFKQITKLDDENLNIMTDWMFEWWGKKDGYSLESVRAYLQTSFQKKRLPQTYGLFLDGKIIGMCEFTLWDLRARPDIYPWLANVYVDKAYRGQGYGRELLKHMEEEAKKNLPFDEVFLYTIHDGLYEKFGWKYICEIDTYHENPRIQKLYKIDLKKLRAKSEDK